MVIGGAEDRTSDCELLRVFVRISGGADARIVLITTASGVPAQSFAAYATAFRRLGAGGIRELRLASHEQADDSETVTALAQATGIFLTGGDQARLEFLVGSRVNLALRGRAAEKSLVIAGTSAGAMALGSVMILGGDLLRTRPGLGLLPTAIIDAHFTQRGRLPRLAAAVARHPSHLGIGIDEDTAVLVRPGRLDVLGRGEVATVHAAPGPAPDPDPNPAPVAGSPAPPGLLAPPGPDGGRAPGMRLHRLHADDAFDLEGRHPLP